MKIDAFNVMLILALTGAALLTVGVYVSFGIGNGLSALGAIFIFYAGVIKRGLHDS